MPTRDRTRPRRGFTLAELMIALMLLGTVSAIFAPLMLASSAQREAARQRQAGLILAENRLDQLLARARDELAPDTVATAVASEASNGSELPVPMPGLEHSVTVVDRPEDTARQITVEVRWRNRSGDTTAPVRISGWAFAPRGETP